MFDLYDGMGAAAAWLSRYPSQSKSLTASFELLSAFTSAVVSILSSRISTTGVSVSPTCSTSAPSAASAVLGSSLAVSTASSRIGFSRISSRMVSASSIRESCNSLIACCSWGVITSCC